MTMKQLETTFLAILFAGYGMAVPFDVLLNTTENLTTISEEGSSTTTAEPSLPFDNVPVYCREGIALNETLTRVKEDFYKLDIKVRDYTSRINKVLKTIKNDKGWDELKNYVPSAERKFECYCEEQTCEPCFSHRELGPCRYNYYCTDRFVPTTVRQISDCPDPPNAESCSEFTNMRTSFNNNFLHLATQVNETVKKIRFSVKFVNESIRSTDSSSEFFSRRHCKDPTNTLHAPEAAKLLEGEVNHYKLQAEDISRNLIDIETKIDQIDGRVQIMAESAVKKMTDATKNWACCMKRVNFNVRVEGIDCEGSGRFDKLFFRNRSWKGW